MAKHKKLSDYWFKAGFFYFDIYEGYMRISDHEFDVPGATIILIDAVGAFKGYTLYETEEEELIEVALEFSEEMSRALYATFKWLQIVWTK